MLMPRTKINKPKGSKYHKLFLEVDGKYKIVFKAISKNEVNRKRAEIQAQSIDTNALVAKRTFVNLYREFAEYKLAVGENENIGGKVHSMKQYMSMCNKHIVPNFDQNILVNEINEQVAIDFFTKLRGKGVSWITCENVVMTFKTALKYAKRKTYISSIGPMEDFKCKDTPELIAVDPSEMKNKETPMITMEQAKRLITYFDPSKKAKSNTRDEMNFCIVCLFLFTGMRMSEVRGLKWKAIDFINGFITVELTMVGTTKGYGKKDGSRRTYPIHPILLEILTRWKALHTRHFTPHKISWVFPSLMKTEEYIVPVCDRTIRDMLNIAYDALGFAKIKYVAEKGRAAKKRVVVINSIFGTAPTKTFRHFAATCLWDAQNSNEALTDNFVCNYLGHRDAKFSKGLYGNHKNLRSGSEHRAKIDQALRNAIPLTVGVSK
tara:strand:+ start:712 stop:2016 length:1305 start_codon:yes stop_codon:yes gene_type:complete